MSELFSVDNPQHAVSIYCRIVYIYIYISIYKCNVDAINYYLTSIPVQYLHSIRAKITCYILSSSPLVLQVQQPPRRKLAPEDACPGGCLPRRMPAPEDACPGGCLPRRMPAPEDACPGGCLPRRMPAPEDACPGGCLPRRKLSADLF